MWMKMMRVKKYFINAGQKVEKEAAAMGEDRPYDFLAT
jgi:hypothetical protein